jgi:membrane protease YdiL (CAAX protease family)
MRPFRALVIYILFVFVGGALLAPWLHGLAQAVAGTFPRLADAPFHRYVNRSLLVLALIGVWPLLKALGARTAADLGWVKPAGQWGRLGTGFALGFLSLAIVAGVAWLGGARSLQEEWPAGKLAGRLLGAVATAAVVGVMEETLFRGGIFAGLRRVLDWRLALGLSSAVYALVHFLARAQHTGEVTWHSGLELLPRMLAGFGDWQALVPGFVNLTLAGALLALAFERTGNLYFSIGLHAGWIFWLKSYGTISREVAGANLWFYGSTKLTDGWLACAALSLTWIAVAGLARRRTRPEAA